MEDLQKAFLKFERGSEMQTLRALDAGMDFDLCVPAGGPYTDLHWRNSESALQWLYRHRACDAARRDGSELVRGIYGSPDIDQDDRPWAQGLARAAAVRLVNADEYRAVTGLVAHPDHPITQHYEYPDQRLQKHVVTTQQLAVLVQPSVVLASGDNSKPVFQVYLFIAGHVINFFFN